MLSGTLRSDRLDATPRGLLRVPFPSNQGSKAHAVYRNSFSWEKLAIASEAKGPRTLCDEESMTPRSSVLQLARLVAKDLAAAPASEGARSVGPALASSPEAVLAVLDLLISETRKKRPNDALIAALLFMLNEALREARMSSESRNLDEPPLADAVRAKLNQAAEAGQLSPEVLLMVAQQFAAAKLDIGEGLRAHLMEIADEVGAGMGPESGPDAIAAHYADMASGLGHDPFLIHGQMSELLSAYPAEQRLVIIESIALSDVAAMRDAALGWLLDPDPGIARVVAQMVHRAAERGLLSPVSAGRLVVMRNWVADDVKSTIDKIGRLHRQRGAMATPGTAVQIGAVAASGCDGAGAQSFFVQIKRGRKLGLASLLVKHRFGVRDAWLRDGMSKREADLMLGDIAGELDPFDASLDIVQTAIANALAVGIARNSPPPFGLVQFVEAVGLTAVQPAAVSTEQLLDQLLHDAPPERISLPAITRALAASKRWPRRFACVDSWFEDIDGDAPVLGGARTKKQRQDIVLTQVLPDQRSRWATLLAWTAAAARDEVDGDDWIDFALVAREMLGPRPLKHIPIACWIAQNTADAVTGTVRA